MRIYFLRAGLQLKSQLKAFGKAAEDSDSASAS